METTPDANSNGDDDTHPLLHDDYRIALYYCYISIDNPDTLVDFHQTWRDEFGGRIRISPEGLNGVLSGRYQLLQTYETDLRRHLLLSTSGESDDTDWELDVKYCRLRPELPVEKQLFDRWQIQKTQQVVGLVNVSSTDTTKRNRKKQAEKKVREEEIIFHRSLQKSNPTPHLSPEEWNSKLQQVTAETPNIMLIDCRNAYESDIGQFRVPGTTTLLTNTRKYEELATILLQQKERIQEASHVFMYCTGGVRCERASGYLQTLLRESQEEHSAAPPQVYQLHGGIQRYLEQQQHDEEPGYYCGKNFVFDPRRTDPLTGGTEVVGRCRICDCPHDDYDNGKSPVDAHPARCCQCRVLLLVCEACRSTVCCWGEQQHHEHRPRLLCGGGICVHRPPPREIKS